MKIRVIALLPALFCAHAFSECTIPDGLYQANLKDLVNVNMSEHTKFWHGVIKVDSSSESPGIKLSLIYEPEVSILANQAARFSHLPFVPGFITRYFSYTESFDIDEHKVETKQLECEENNLIIDFTPVSSISSTDITMKGTLNLKYEVTDRRLVAKGSSCFLEHRNNYWSSYSVVNSLNKKEKGACIFQKLH